MNTKCSLDNSVSSWWCKEIENDAISPREKKIQRYPMNIFDVSASSF